MSINPILTREFDDLMNKLGYFEKKPKLGISLSGGVDSFALLILLHEWLKKRNGKLVAFIVDHGLRNGSDQEAEEVKRLVLKKKIKCRILLWSGAKPKTRIMQTARNFRYDLLMKACLKEKILHLFFGHHLNDNIETFLMRSERLGHKAGLASIRNIREELNVRILRPLIEVEKSRLLDTCNYHNQKWINDPSNLNRKFERVRIRENQKTNLNRFKIKKKIDFYVQQNKILETKISLFFAQNLIFERVGIFKLNMDSFNELSENLKILVFKKTLTTNSGLLHPPKLRAINLLIQQLKSENFSKRTLHQNYIYLKDKFIIISRECKKDNKIKVNLIPNKKIVWDNRFLLFSRFSRATCYSICEFNIEKINNLFFKHEKRKIHFDILKTLPLIKIRNNYMIPFISSEKKLIKSGVSFFFSPKVPLTNN